MGRNKPKEIGTRQESAICNVINEWAGQKVCERVVLHGNRDHGDLRITVDDLVLTGESKHCKRYPSDGMLADFRGQTAIENENAGQDGGVLFVNLPGRSINRMEVWMQKSTYMRLNGVDELLASDDLSARARALLSRLLEDGEWDWIRLTLVAFMHLCWGSPAWGLEELN